MNLLLPEKQLKKKCERSIMGPTHSVAGGM